MTRNRIAPALVLLLTLVIPARAAVTERVSVDSHGVESNGVVEPLVVAISADGNVVAFTSYASDLVPGLPEPLAEQVYVHDRSTGVTSVVSLGPGNVPGDGSESGGPQTLSLSADGRFVAFVSGATNLVPGDTNLCSGLTVPGSCPDVFVHDRMTGVTTRVSVASDGTQGDNPSNAGWPSPPTGTWSPSRAAPATSSSATR